MADIPVGTEAVPSIGQRWLTSNARTLAAVVVTWGIVAVIATTTAFIAIRGSTLSEWFSIFGPMTSYYAVWVVVSLLIYRIVEWSSGSPARRALGAVAHLLLFGAVALSLPFIVHSGDWRTWLIGERAPGFHTLAVVVYALNLGGSLLIHFYRLSVARDRDAREARLKSSLLENQLNLARMDALKMQINPHFLFNALNSIAALIETDRKVEAYHATELLGGLLRSSLDRSGDRMLTLEQELDFVRRYVDVEKVRFGSRIEFAVHADEAAMEASVPALILQPLIENAIKHTLGSAAKRVLIEVRAERRGDMLDIRLCDDGPGVDPTDRPKQGYGLQNVSKRLELLYDGKAEFEMANRTEGGVRATIRIPLSAAY